MLQISCDNSVGEKSKAMQANHKDFIIVYLDKNTMEGRQLY